MCAPWIGSTTAHLVAGENIDLVGGRALLIRNSVHVESIHVIAEVGERRRFCDVAFPNAAFRDQWHDRARLIHACTVIGDISRWRAGCQIKWCENDFDLPGMRHANGIYRR